LLKVTLPGDVEQEAGGPQEDDCHMTKVVKIFGKASSVIPSWLSKSLPVAILYQTDVLSGLERGLAKLGKFGCHVFY